MKAQPTAIDPVCHMTVDPAIAAGSVDYKGQTYYFCSTHCVEKFREDPQRFLQPLTQQITIEPIPTAAVDQPPGISAKAPIEYTCPMHPEIVRNGPGSCPICGMALEPRTVVLADAPNPELVDMARPSGGSLPLALC